MTYYEIVVRTIAAFVILFTMTKISGKKQISELTFFDYATGITIGAIAASTSLNSNLTVLEGLTSLAVWTGLTLLLGYLSLKLSFGRVLIHGEPTIVIKNGQVNKEALSAVQLTTDDLSMMLRREKVFDISKVAYAILEPNGKLSVLEKANEQVVTRQDMRIPSPAFKYFPTQVINDGRIIDKNMQEINLDKGWLMKQIQAQGYDKVEEIFYAQLQSDGSLYLSPQVVKNIRGQ